MKQKKLTQIFFLDSETAFSTNKLQIFCPVFLLV